jgi:hypothetical protein
MDSPDLEDYSENSFRILPVYQKEGTPQSWEVQSKKKVFPLIVRPISLSTKKTHLLGVSFLLGQIIFGYLSLGRRHLGRHLSPCPFSFDDLNQNYSDLE